MKRRQFLGLFTLTAAAGLLAGCADEAPRVDKVLPPAEEEIPNLDADQVRSVLNELTKVLTKADEAKNADLLVERVKDPALTMRRGYYTLAQKTDAKVPTLFMDQSTVTVTKSEEWPRAIVLGTEIVEGELPSVLLITQADARSPYMLESWARLFPSSKLQTIKVSEGSPIVKVDSAEYVETPLKAMQTWGSRLNNAELDPQRYALDDFTKFYLDEKQSLNEQVVKVGTVTYRNVLVEDRITAVKLADGSALVFGWFNQDQIYTRTAEKGALKVQGVHAALLEGDDDEVKLNEPVTAYYTVAVAMVLPVVGSKEPIKVIAAERVLREVKR
ncbi:hypothetical protein NXS08_01190 [Gleimia sp. 6138-11-ORH1]|uniref:hypothetical protein n=1 Tax=Gleimia sp. 6138-11-ORH1 TaxID=2973937 RepID=UPI002168CB7A|nr:hypothetical protein [Gleimia sp. 6138-11-ORH1]MCS4484107.1 hypothetical protein [Gleimia sp. 6138-11-ORH1]